MFTFKKLALLWEIFKALYEYQCLFRSRNILLNGYDDTELRFVDLEQAEFCWESAIHDISCHSDGNHSRKILL